MATPLNHVKGRGSRNALAGQLEPVAERLEARAEELATRQVQAMRANFPTYKTERSVPDAPLIASALRNVQRVITTLREGRAPTPEEVHEAWVARERTEQGVPSAEQITGYRSNGSWPTPSSSRPPPSASTLRSSPRPPVCCGT